MSFKARHIVCRKAWPNPSLKRRGPTAGAAGRLWFILRPAAPSVGPALARTLGHAKPTLAATMHFAIRRAEPEDAEACIALRGLTRENPISAQTLQKLGITADSWKQDIASGVSPGWVAFSEAEMSGYCFGDSETGEILALAVHSTAEGQGLGKELLQLVATELNNQGHSRLFLGCSPDPKVRSYGFYRHSGWRSTGSFDARGDELLELQN